jgi:hypothetical protein
MLGYKLFYKRKKWDPDPLWAFNPKDGRGVLPGDKE